MPWQKKPVWVFTTDYLIPFLVIFKQVWSLNRYTFQYLHHTHPNKFLFVIYQPCTLCSRPNLKYQKWSFPSFNLNSDPTCTFTILTSLDYPSHYSLIPILPPAPLIRLLTRIVGRVYNLPSVQRLSLLIHRWGRDMIVIQYNQNQKNNFIIILLYWETRLGIFNITYRYIYISYQIKDRNLLTI